MFFYAYTFKGQVHMFAGGVKIVSHSDSLVLQGKCNIEISLSPVWQTNQITC